MQLNKHPRNNIMNKEIIDNVVSELREIRRICNASTEDEIAAPIFSICDKVLNN